MSFPFPQRLEKSKVEMVREKEEGNLFPEKEKA